LCFHGKKNSSEPFIHSLSAFQQHTRTQPHSEVAALALFLDRCFSGKELKKNFKGKLWIVPNECGKVVLRGESD